MCSDITKDQKCHDRGVSHTLSALLNNPLLAIVMITASPLALALVTHGFC